MKGGAAAGWVYMCKYVHLSCVRVDLGFLALPLWRWLLVQLYTHSHTQNEKVRRELAADMCIRKLNRINRVELACHKGTREGKSPIGCIF